ncbi:MAG: hypothetical protein A49_02500 [Methyloceanibacter sp.]|nr:MAG: hypothetical protein A49_02500 [Methyloceanibacter sp.]
MLTAILEVLDITIVNVAVPHMLGAFAATPDQVTWILTSYIVAAAVVMPLTGFSPTGSAAGACCFCRSRDS